MERRELLSMIGIGAAGFLASGTASAGSHQQDDKDRHQDPKHAEHLKVMTACIVACNEAAHHSLAYLAGDRPEHREHAAKIHELTMDCQDVCALTGRLMARFSSVVKPLHQACAEVCSACASACDKGQHEAVKKCAEACRACEKMCRECCASTT